MRQENCGVLGGSDMAFLRYYANLGIDLATNPKHQSAWMNSTNKESYNWLLEQFLLAACIDYHRFHPDSPHRGISIKYLFSSFEQGFDPNEAARAGFTHLLGGSKSHSPIAKRLEARTPRHDPPYYRPREALPPPPTLTPRPSTP